MAMVINKKSEIFWAVFSDISNDILSSPNDKNLIKRIDNLVKQLGDLDWEYGPYGDEFYFCLSPNSNIENIPIVKKIIACAPVLKGWNFLSFKPKKEWVGHWKMQSDKGDILNINSKNWTVVAYKFPDNTYDLDVKLDNWDHDANDAISAVNILLVNVIGEEKYMNLVESISIVNEFEDDSKNKGILFRHLDEVIV